MVAYSHKYMGCIFVFFLLTRVWNWTKNVTCIEREKESLELSDEGNL
jgi:hypothetical protein